MQATKGPRRVWGAKLDKAWTKLTPLWIGQCAPVALSGPHRFNVWSMPGLACCDMDCARPCRWLGPCLEVHMHIRPTSAIVLAAGMGLRLRPLPTTLPKAMVQCASRPLLEYAMEFARHVIGPNGRLVVVGGYEGERVREVMERKDRDAVYAHNPQYTKGNLLSVAAGLSAVEGSFLLMNVDHIYPLAFGDRLLVAQGDVVAAVDFDRHLGDDDMKVKLDRARRIVAISKQLSQFDGGYIGMTMVREGGLGPYREALAATLARRGDAAVAEHVLQELADRGQPAQIADMSGMRWFEVDTPQELLMAEEGVRGGALSEKA